MITLVSHICFIFLLFLFLYQWARKEYDTISSIWVSVGISFAIALSFAALHLLNYMSEVDNGFTQVFSILLFGYIIFRTIEALIKFIIRYIPKRLYKKETSK